MKSAAQGNFKNYEILAVVATLLIATAAAHAGSWRILGYDASTQSLKLEHDGATYGAECFEHVEPTLEADDDSRGITAGWRAELATKDNFPCAQLAALVGKSLPEYKGAAAMPFDSYAVDIARLGIFVEHSVGATPKHDPKAFSAYDSGGRDREWWQLSINHAEAK